MSSPVVHAVDLFCGIGGLTHGLDDAGVSVKAGFDMDDSCRYAYEANNAAEFVSADIRDVQFCDLKSHYSSADIRVLAGCAPCQPFSAHTRRDEYDRDDSYLILEFGRLVEEGKPEVVVVENVPGCVHHDAFRSFMGTLNSIGYHVACGVLACEDHGIPQTRRRFVLLASLTNPIFLPAPTHKRATVREWIGDRPPIDAGQCHPDDTAHVAMSLSPRNQRRIRQSKLGGTWHDWDAELVNPCHRRSNYPAPYGRMTWAAPAPTITTQYCYYSTGRFGHPEQDRALSIREGALLQTFPVNYDLLDDDRSVGIRGMARHVGNAVPVKLGEAVGRSVMESIIGNRRCDES